MVLESLRRCGRRSLHTRMLALLAVAGISFTAVAQEDSRGAVVANAALDEALDRLHQPYTRHDSPGAIVAILKAGRVVHLKGYGLANREHRIPWRADTKYTFFSLTKPMVAVAFLRLQQQHRLSLDDEIQKFLPDFPRFRYALTIRHLLTHTSGLWEDEDLVHLLGVSTSEGAITLDEMYRMLERQPDLPFRPGTDNYYNDGGLRVAARILERVTGQSFGEALRRLVFDPAGMRTAATKLTEPMYFPDQATAYLLDRTPPAERDQGALYIGGSQFENSGDGATNGSILDLVSFAQYLSAPREHGSFVDRLAAPVEYHSGISGAYRTCFYASRYRGIEVVGHGGYLGKEIAYLRGLDVWIIYMRNALDYGRQSSSEYLHALIDAVLVSFPEYARYGDPATRTPGRPSATAPDEQFTDQESQMLVGRYLEPRSGYPVQICASGGRLLIRILGASADLVHVENMKERYRSSPYSTGPFVELRLIEGSLFLQYTDWEAPRPLARTDQRGASTKAPLQVAGIYRSSVYGTSYEIAAIGADQIRLTIGAGVRTAEVYRLERVAADVFEGTLERPTPLFDMDLVVAFEGRGTIASTMTVSTHSVRGLRFDRMIPAS